jgi:hypothetical protein
MAITTVPGEPTYICMGPHPIAFDTPPNSPLLDQMSTASKEEEQKMNRNIAGADTIGSPRALEDPSLVSKENSSSHVMTRADALPSLSPATTTASLPNMPMHSKSSPPPLSPRETPIVTTAENDVHTERNIQDERDSDGSEKPPGNDSIPLKDSSEQAGTSSVQHRSMHPHMRKMSQIADVQLAVSYSVLTVCGHQTNTREQGWPTPVPRAPRAPHTYSRSPPDYEELQRVKAQLIKTRDELDSERKLHSQMQRKVEAETRASYSAAVASTLNDLLFRQAETLAAKAKYEGKWRELQYREDRIAQLERYLSAGQAQLKYQLEQQGIRPMREVDEAKLKSEVELSMKRQYADIEGKIAIQVDRLRLQDAAQKVREQQYKALLRPSLEREIREEFCQSSSAANDAKAAEGVVGEHRRTVGKAETSDMQPNRAFLEGYAACNRAQKAVYDMRNGTITPDSPKLAFLFDPTHPENPLNIGHSIGRLEKAADATTTSGMKVGEMNGKKEKLAETGTNGARAAATDIVDGGRSQSGDNKASFAPRVGAQLNRPTQQVQTRFTSVSEVCAKVVPQDPPIAQGARNASDCGAMPAGRSLMCSEQEEKKTEADCADAKVVEEVKLIDL